MPAGSTSSSPARAKGFLKVTVFSLVRVFMGCRLSWPGARRPRRGTAPPPWCLLRRRRDFCRLRIRLLSRLLSRRRLLGLLVGAVLTGSILRGREFLEGHRSEEHTSELQSLFRISYT